MTRYRCPIRRLHADGSTCTHRMRTTGHAADETCPGATGYEATCTCGHTISAGIRAIVEEQRSSHLHDHVKKADDVDRQALHGACVDEAAAMATEPPTAFGDAMASVQLAGES